MTGKENEDSAVELFGSWLLRNESGGQDTEPTQRFRDDHSFVYRDALLALLVHRTYQEMRSGTKPQQPMLVPWIKSQETILDLAYQRVMLEIEHSERDAWLVVYFHSCINAGNRVRGLLDFSALP